MTYNKCCKVYEKDLWMKLGSQFKFKVNGKDRLSSYYPVTYVFFPELFPKSNRMNKDFKITFCMIENR